MSNAPDIDVLDIAKACYEAAPYVRWVTDGGRVVGKVTVPWDEAPAGLRAFAIERARASLAAIDRLGYRLVPAGAP